MNRYDVRRNTKLSTDKATTSTVVSTNSYPRKTGSTRQDDGHEKIATNTSSDCIKSIHIKMTKPLMRLALMYPMDRDHLLRVLKKHEANGQFSAITMGHPQFIRVDKAINDVLKERVRFNGLIFNGVVDKTKELRVNNSFLRCLHNFCMMLYQRYPSIRFTTVHPQALFERIVSRIARSVTVTDSFFNINCCVQSPDLLLVPLQDELPPLEVDIFVSDEHVHCNIHTENIYGFYRKEDITCISPMPMAHNTASPWICVNALLSEKVNYSTNDFVRNLALKFSARKKKHRLA